MKVILSGYHNPHFLTVTEYIEFAIEKLGHQLITFDDRRHIIPGRIRSRSRLLNHIDLNMINGQLVNLARKREPQLVIITGGYRINSRSIKMLKKCGIVVVLWTTDQPREFSHIINAAPFYDHIFCQGTEAIDLFHESGIKNAKWLPMACDPEHHRPVDLSREEFEKYGSDVAFVGSNYPNRFELFENILDVDLAIWGPGWGRLPADSGLREHIRGKAQPPAIWRKIYSACKIIIAPHYKDPENKVPVHQISPRIFEAMACGAFVLTDGQRDAGFLFEDGEHLVRYNNIEDLREKITFFLENPKQRIEIADKGRKEVISNHTYVNRIEKLLSTATLT